MKACCEGSSLRCNINQGYRHLADKVHGDHAAICAGNILTLIRDGPKVMVIVISTDTATRCHHMLGQLACLSPFYC